MPTHRVVTMEELTQYLHLPEKVVAKQLGICLTSLKKLCRQHGITRWPYRKLKSLDKKIAKAETGSGGSGEDPGTLKARAEELKKEKMAVAFTYGLKDGKDDDSVSSSEPGVPAVPEAKATKPKKPKPSGLVTKPAASAVLLTNPNTPTPASALAKGKTEWPFGKDSPGIPTPPEEPIAPQETDIFAEAVADVMADDPTLDDENHMPPQLHWDRAEDKEGDDDGHDHADDHADDDGHESDDAKEATAEVKFNGTPLKGVLQKDKNGGMKMTLMLPNGLDGLSGGLGASGQLAGKVIVSDADMRIASALASVSSPREPFLGAKEGKGGDEAAKDAAPPKFDMDEEPPEPSFGHEHELMDSEFFSAMRHGEDGGEDTVHLEDHDHDERTADEHSPSSLDSVPAHSARGGSEDDASERLPAGDISAEVWDEETRLWLSPDTPQSKKTEGSVSSTPQASAPTGAAAVILGGRAGSSAGQQSGTPGAKAEPPGLDIASVLTT